MILYDSRRLGGLLVLTSCKGSPFFSCTLFSLPLALLSGALTLVIKLFPDFFGIEAAVNSGAVPAGGDADLIDHPTASRVLFTLQESEAASGYGIFQSHNCVDEQVLSRN